MSGEIHGVENITVNEVDKAIVDDGSELYNRQSSLGLNVPKSVTVIGGGGVGMWVAMNFALIGVPEMAVVDDDRVDVSNLNRTLFKQDQVGMFKVHAISELIAERRPGCKVVGLSKRYETLEFDEKKYVDGLEVTIDCRDSIAALKGMKKSPMIGGYNGLSGTLHINADFTQKKIFGAESTGYTIIPSYVIVPEFLAASIVNYICAEERVKDEKIISLDFKSLSKSIDKEIPESIPKTVPKKRSPRKKEVV